MKKFIDAKGKNCPIPVIMAKKEIESGVNFFEIEVDNKIAVENLKKIAKNQGFEIKITKDKDNFKVDFSNGCEECEDILNKLEGKKELGNWAVFVNKEIIGSGDDELGKSLMKMFLYTISEGEDLPSSILFMNGGVKVPTLNEQAIEHLKVLESKGVELLVCGACLNFYGLEEQLSVGKVSNMYDITNVMKEVSKVITI